MHTHTHTQPCQLAFNSEIKVRIYLERGNNRLKNISEILFTRPNLIQFSMVIQRWAATFSPFAVKQNLTRNQLAFILPD